MNKKYLPLVLLGVGILVLVGVFVFIKAKAAPVADEDAALREIPLAERPYTTLTPRDDGHWLDMVVDNIHVDGAVKMEYELVYALPDGRNQGVPGMVELFDQKKVERPLLLGSESSGKFRYDEGVEGGTLTLRFRNDSGKLIGKLSSDFKMLQNREELKSADGALAYKFEETPEKPYFVVMDTFGLPKDLEGVASGPYGIFASSGGPYSGTITLRSGKVKRYDGVDWRDLSSEKSPDVGVFVTTN